MKIIGITSDGFGAGKDTVAAIIAMQHNYLVWGFTETLMDHIYDELMYQKFPTKVLWYQYCAEHKYETDPNAEGFWVRKILQGYGQFYRSVDINHWVDLWEKRVWQFATDIVAPSVRFPNEANRIRGLRGKIVRVVSPRMVENTNQVDPSELSMVDYPVDYTINNDGTINDLRRKVTDMLSVLLEGKNIEQSSDQSGGGTAVT